MKLSFKETKMLLANVNVRSELRGEERDPAGDLKLVATLPNERLADLHPGLKALLYHYDAVREDFVDQGKKNDPEYAPHLRLPQLASPLKWEDEMAGAKIALAVPGSKAAVELDPVKVNNLSIEPLEGGTIVLTMRIQAHPDEKRFGKLCLLAQSDVIVTLEPAEGASPE